MSAHYKVIRKTREAVKELKNGVDPWNDTKIAKHIGVSVSIVKDLVVIDEVAMNLRQPTIDKFQKFLDTRNTAKAYMADEERKSKPQPPEETYPAPAWNDKPPDEPVKEEPVYMWKKVRMPEDLTEQLSELATKFASKGYRLDCVLTLQHKPE